MSPESNKPGCLPGVLIQLLRALAGGKPPRAASAPYRKKDFFFSKAERSFYELLLRAIPDEYVLFAKVRLCDLVYVASGEGRASAMNRILSKHVDFVLCDRGKLQPQLVIELDDSSHQRAHRQQRDAFVDSVLEQAGLPVAHFACKQAYSLDELRQAITSKLGAANPSPGQPPEL